MAIDYKALRRRAKISQVKLADMVGVSERTVRRFEKGESHNKKLALEYEKIHAKEMAQEAITRYQEFEDYIKKGGYQTPASLKYFEDEEKGIGGLSGLDTSLSTDINEVKTVEKKIKKFLDMEGLEDFKKANLSRKEKLLETTGEDTVRKALNRISLMDEIKAIPGWREYISSIIKDGYSPSQQVLEMVLEMTARRMTRKQILDFFKTQINDYIEKQNREDEYEFNLLN